MPKTWQGLLLLIGIAFVLTPPRAWAAPVSNLESAAVASPAVAHPSRFLPFIDTIPHDFLTGAYAVKLSVTEMRIDHMAEHTHCPMKQRGCTLSLSYSQPVGQQLFSSRFDLPLLSSEGVTSHWGAASLGDYVIHLSNTPLLGSNLRLMASARF